MSCCLCAQCRGSDFTKCVFSQRETFYYVLHNCGLLYLCHCVKTLRFSNISVITRDKYFKLRQDSTKKGIYITRACNYKRKRQ